MSHQASCRLVREIMRRSCSDVQGSHSTATEGYTRHLRVSTTATRAQKHSHFSATFRQDKLFSGELAHVPHPTNKTRQAMAQAIAKPAKNRRSILLPLHRDDLRSKKKSRIQMTAKRLERSIWVPRARLIWQCLAADGRTGLAPIGSTRAHVQRFRSSAD